MGTTATAGQGPWEELRRQRAELRESMNALELALAGPVSSGQHRWAERVHVALVELSADVRAHIAFTEGPGGLYVDLLANAPRLSGSVARLTEEHVAISELLEDLLARTDSPAGEDLAPTARRGRFSAARRRA